MAKKDKNSTNTHPNKEMKYWISILQGKEVLGLLLKNIIFRTKPLKHG